MAHLYTGNDIILAHARVPPPYPPCGAELSFLHYLPGTQSQAGGVPQFQVGVPPGQDRMGTPWPGQDGVPAPHQRLNNRARYLLRGGRYVSCVHAGGLPCFPGLTLTNNFNTHLSRLSSFISTNPAY